MEHGSSAVIAPVVAILIGVAGVAHSVRLLKSQDRLYKLAQMQLPFWSFSLFGRRHRKVDIERLVRYNQVSALIGTFCSIGFFILGVISLVVVVSRGLPSSG
jgi:hypothetical protein